jgi:A118 family predicted phage portal protein
VNITRFIAYLNETKHLHIDGSYYSYIETWKDWWRGYDGTFHKVTEQVVDGSTQARTMSSLRMAKHACEDWATLLLNDRTTATVADASSAKWLLGDQDQTGGILGKLSFWPNANRLVEEAFRSGTGAFVMSVEGAALQNGVLQKTPTARVSLDYLPAECILPITVRHGLVTEAAFASGVSLRGDACIYLQTHQLVRNPAGGLQYQITNEFFKGQGEETDCASYQPQPRPEGMIGRFFTGSDVPWFALFSPAGVKNISGGTGLGMAVFSEALDAAKQVDLAFDNYGQDIYLGGKKVFYNKRLVETRFNSDGQPYQVPPDAARRRIFYQLPGGDPDASPDWHEYNPDLRVDDNSKAVQDALDYFSFKVGLGTHHYQFNSGNIATATQYNGDRQDMVQHANRHQIQIEAALIRIFRALLWAGRELLGAPVDPETEVSINWDDSYITDQESRLATMREDALSGLIPRYRYLMARYGLNEAAARQMAQEAQEDSQSGEPLGFGEI